MRRFVSDADVDAQGTGSITEGIGQGRVTENLKGAPIDDAVLIEDSKTIRMVFRRVPTHLGANRLTPRADFCTRTASLWARARR